MDDWKKVIKLVNVWQHTKRIPGTSIKDVKFLLKKRAEDENIFIEELKSKYILIERSDVDKVEVVFKPGIEPPEGIVYSVRPPYYIFNYCDADREAMDERNKWIGKTTDPLSEEEWENIIIDEQAEEETELNDAKTKDINWNRIIMNSQVSKRLKNE